VQDSPEKTDVGEEIEQLYREQGARIWRAVALWAGDSEVASDAVAGAFAQALGRGDRKLGARIWRASLLRHRRLVLDA